MRWNAIFDAEIQLKNRNQKEYAIRFADSGGLNLDNCTSETFEQLVDYLRSLLYNQKMCGTIPASHEEEWHV